MGLDQSDKDRIAGRVWAEEAISVATCESAAFLEGFNRAIRKHQPREEVQQPYTMTEAEAIEFEKNVIGFGKHADETYGTAPTDYIVWLAEASATLLKYARSDRFKRRQED